MKFTVISIDRPGALHRIIEPLKKKNINEVRTLFVRGCPGAKAFGVDVKAFGVDVEGSLEDFNVVICALPEVISLHILPDGSDFPPYVDLTEQELELISSALWDPWDPPFRHTENGKVVDSAGLPILQFTATDDSPLVFIEDDDDAAKSMIIQTQIAERVVALLNRWRPGDPL